MMKIIVKIVNIYSNSILVTKLLKIKFRIMFPSKMLKLKFIINYNFLIKNLNKGQQSKIM